MLPTVVSRVLLFVFLCPVLVIAAGQVDTSFNASLLKVDANGKVFRSVIQPDGKIIITGIFNAVGSGGRKNIARLNADGTLDTSFQPPRIVSQYSGDALPPIQAIGLTSDGKIILGGRFAKGLKRLNPDGTEDTTFDNSSWLDLQREVFDLKVLADDRIMLSGYRGRDHLSVLDADGSVALDSNFRAERFALQPDGKVVAFDSISATGPTLYRLKHDLTLDNTFTSVRTGGAANPFNDVHAITVQPDGKIVIGGSFIFVNGGEMRYLARVHSNGAVDTDFHDGTGGPNSIINAILYQPDNKIVLGGKFNSFDDVAKNRVVRLNMDGTVDPSLDVVNGFSAVHDLDIQTDGKIVTSGTLTNPVGTIPSPVVRLTTDGLLDPSFDGPVGNAGGVFNVSVLPDDKILVGGDFTHAGGVSNRSIARFNADGTLDTSFHQTTVTKPIIDFDVFSDGKIAIVTDDTALRRLDPDGSLDAGFTPSAAETVKVLSDGKMLVSRITSGVPLVSTVRRLNANGTIDVHLAAVDGRVHKIELQPDGKVLIGGTFSGVNGTTRNGIARLNADGTLDSTFNTPGGPNGVKDIDVLPDGKVLIAGEFLSISFTNTKGLARLNPNGTLDTSFLGGLNYFAEAVKVQPDGKILVGGQFVAVDGLPRERYARLNADGSLDRGFIVGTGADSYVNDIDQQSDGKVIIVGYFSSVGDVPAPGIVRLLNPPTVARTPFDYDGDGRSDVSVFRPSDNTWYILRSSDSVITYNIFAQAGDIPVPADYDGDGKTDIAIFRPSSGEWWSMRSSDGTPVVAQWGAAGDVPRPSDFDGDGRADQVVYRPSTSYWYGVSSSTGVQSNGWFGVAGDIPIIGDFDGDGKSDKATFRPSAGDWRYESSLDGSTQVTHWGGSTDVPAAADFDGDGRTDLAIYRPAEGNWYILNSSDQSFTAMNFGLSEDRPIPADYDGDGRADIAVYRPSTGNWYLMRSTAGFTGINFGISSDIPTEGSFVD